MPADRPGARVVVLTWPPSMVVVLHGACAAIYMILLALTVIGGRASPTGRWLSLAVGLTALWAASVALSSSDPTTGVAGFLGLTRAVAWFGFTLHLYRRSVVRDRQMLSVFVTMGLLVVLLIGIAPLIDVVSATSGVSLWSIDVGARLGFAVCNILLIENLYLNTPPDLRWHVNLLCVAIGGVALYDLALYSDAVLFRKISLPLFEGRASVLAMAAPLLAVAAARNRRWAIDIHVSREVVFHTATLVGSGVFLLALALAGEVFRDTAAEWGVVAQVSLMVAGLLAVAVFLTSSSTRARARSLIVDNFFTHRYDYRQEWARCIATLSAEDGPANQPGSLQSRAIRAVANVVNSPAGILFVGDPRDTALRWAGSWNLPAVTAPIPRTDRLMHEFGSTCEVVRLDQDCLDACASRAAWREELPDLWIAVPLVNVGQLLGVILLVPPRAAFKLDNEVMAVLRVVGQEVAIHIAEQRARQRATQNEQLHEYGKRFAFVIHDIKNVAGQLSMLLANAEQHAANPEFQRDMLETVRASVSRVGNLLAKLQPRDSPRDPRLLVPIERIRAVAEQVRAIRATTVLTDDDGRATAVLMEPSSFDAVLLHLVDNAIEASASGAEVLIRLRHEALSVVVEIIDQGTGMSAEFIRDELFRPFATTKRTGHGIGVFQARELLREAGGDLVVLSRPGQGTTMRLLLPAAGALIAEPVAADRPRMERA